MTNTNGTTSYGDALAQIKGIAGEHSEILLSGLGGGGIVCVVNGRTYRAAQFSTIVRQLKKVLKIVENQ